MCSILSSEKAYQQALPKKRMAAGCLLFNEQDELLIVDLTYKPWWGIPGGVIEVNESPQAGCEREIMEEVGLSCRPLQMLCVDYLPETEARTESLQFLFSGPVLTVAEIAKICLQPAEIRAYQFLPPADALPLLGDGLRRRVSWVLSNLNETSAVYLENSRLPR